MKKILLIHNIITPTRTLLFNKMNDKFKSEGYKFKIIFTSQSEGNRNWDVSKEIKKFTFDYEILNSKQIHLKGNKDNHYFHINFNLFSILKYENPNIIINAGWAGISSFLSCFWAKRNNCKFILWSGSTKYENSWRRTLTKPIVKILVKNSDLFFSYGTRASSYLESLGASKNRIFKLYNTVDIDYFINQSKKLQQDKIKLKKSYGITTKNVILFIGQLIKRKGIFEIIEGFEKFQKNNSDFSLIFVGNGLEEERLKNIINERKIKNVFFPGFIQKDKISELYSIANIFTLPSDEEVWGLSINEAMCFGLPVISTNNVGANVDLIEEGKNGYIMKKNNSDEFQKGLNYIKNNNLIQNNNSLEKIKNFTVDKILEKLKIEL